MCATSPSPCFPLMAPQRKNSNRIWSPLIIQDKALFIFNDQIKEILKTLQGCSPKVRKYMLDLELLPLHTSRPDCCHPRPLQDSIRAWKGSYLKGKRPMGHRLERVQGAIKEKERKGYRNSSYQIFQERKERREREIERGLGSSCVIFQGTHKCEEHFQEEFHFLKKAGLASRKKGKKGVLLYSHLL